MEIREGYKQTAVGIIPQEWDLKIFGDVITVFSSGATPYRGHPEFFKGNIRWITSGELNYNNITDTKEKITEEAVSRTNLKVHPSGTFLIAITGLEAEGTRGRCGFVGLPSTTNQSCMALYPIQWLLDSKYLFHYYLWQGDNLAFKYCQGTKQQSYTANIAKKLPIILPTLPEQQTIAEVLSDTDNLIQSLESLIVKKRLIKQGVMQKLLAQNPKLEWNAKRLGEIGDCLAGGTPSTFNSNYWNGDIIWLPSGRIQNNILQKLDDEITITQLGLKESAAKLIKPKSVLIAITGATCGNIGLLEFEAAANQSVIAIEPYEKVDYRFLYYSLLMIRSDILKNQTGSAQGGVNLNSIKKIELLFPSFERQTHISAILSDMDSEIAILEKKLSKYKSLKQGLMQNLLTGRIRLIQS